MRIEEEDDREAGGGDRGGAGAAKHAGGGMPDDLSPRHIARRLAELAVLAAVVALGISAPTAKLCDAAGERAPAG